jgi:hypothetical protein
MAQALPEKSCDDTVLKYVIDARDVEAAKAQIVKVAGAIPVVFIEMPLSGGQVELLAMVSRLTPSVQQALQALQQDGVMVKQIAAAQFEVKSISFDMG